MTHSIHFHADGLDELTIAQIEEEVTKAAQVFLQARISKITIVKLKEKDG